MNSYKYGQSDPEGHYYGVYEDNSLAPRMDSSRRVWEYSSMANTEDPISVGIPSEQSMVSEVHSIPEERKCLVTICGVFSLRGNTSTELLMISE